MPSYLTFDAHGFSMMLRVVTIFLPTVGMTLVCGPTLTLAFGYNGLSTEELIRQQCDGLPTSRRLLTATSNRQKKEYRFSPLERVGHSDGSPVVSGSTCDVWDFKTSTNLEKWVAVVLTGIDFQRNDTFFVVRENDKGVKKIERFGLELQTTGFSSKGPLTLLWVRRNLVTTPPPDSDKVTKSSDTHREVDRKLAFLYFTDDASSDSDDNDELILISAIVISFITLAATVLSLVRAATCHRSTCFPCWLQRRRHAMPDYNNTYVSGRPSPPEGDQHNNNSHAGSTGRAMRGPETLLLMEIEVDRAAQVSNDGDNDFNNNEYERMLPPNYDQIIGHIVNTRPERETQSRQNGSIYETSTSSVDEGAEVPDAHVDDMATTVVTRDTDAHIGQMQGSQHHPLVVQPTIATNNELPLASTTVTTSSTLSSSAATATSSSSSSSASSNHQSVTSALQQQCSRCRNANEANLDGLNEEEGIINTEELDFDTTAIRTPQVPSPSIATTVDNVEISNSVHNSSSSSTSSSLTSSVISPSLRSSHSSTLPTRSITLSTPPTRRPRLCLLHATRFQGALPNVRFGPRHLSPFEIRFSNALRSEDGSEGVVDICEAPPPSYYDESPPPSYDSLFFARNNQCE